MIQLWSTLFTGQTHAHIQAADEVLLDTQPGTVATLKLDGVLRVREGYTLMGVAVSGDGVLRPELESVAESNAISARQIRLALNQTGLRDAVEAAVAAGDRDLSDWWEYSTEVHRDNPMVEGMIQALGIPAEQADALWALGKGL